MKRITLPLLLVAATAGYAQRVDLDRFSIPFSIQRLPNEPVPLEKRTYGVRAKTSGSIRQVKDDASLYDAIVIPGWRRVENSPTVGVSVTLDDFNNGSNTANTRKEDQRDKDGKVISSTTYFFYEQHFSGRGTAHIDGPVTPLKLSEKEQEELRKKEEAKAKNRFLANVNTTSSSEPAKTGYDVALNQSYTRNSPEKLNAEDARREFLVGKDATFANDLRAFVENSIYRVNSNLAYTYGYPEQKGTDILWIINSKSHPEYATQREAIEAVKTLFATMKANEPIEQLITNMGPLIEYFESLKTKYVSDDKADRKVRYSSYFNLSKIYLYLDMPEKALKEAEGLAANKYDEEDAKPLIEEATKLSEAFKKHQLTSRHIKPF